MSRVIADDVRVAMRDGVRLATDVVRVDGAPPQPALLIRTPYSRAATRMSDDPIGRAHAGWTCVIQDVRGRFDSEGTFDPYFQEAADGADAIAWCASQPWCDGRVATWGGSYLGATQFLAASSSPPALKAMVPIISAAQYGEGWTFEGGAMQAGFTVLWALSMAATDPSASAAQRRRATRAIAAIDAEYRRPLSKTVAREVFPPLARWLDGTVDWRRVDALRRARNLRVPAFHVAGWFDIFCEGSLRAYSAMAGQASQRLVVGPWTHAGAFLDATPEMHFGAQAGSQADVAGEAFRWLSEAIDGRASSGVRVFVMGANRWRDLDGWPPPSQLRSLWFDGDGALVDAAPQATGRDSFDYDPRDPTPTMGGRVLGAFLPMAGPVDQRPLEDRRDVVAYTSPPLPRTLTVIGTITADLHVVSSSRSADVAVKVIDVHPDGRAFNVVDALQRVSFTPGRAKRVQLDVGSTAIVLPRGHRVRVHVSAANFPRLDANPLAAHQTILRGGSRASSVTLPSVPS